MKLSIWKVGYSVVLAAGIVYGFMELRGPVGWGHLMEKRAEIQTLEKQNQALHREIEEKSDHIGRLRDNPDEQELEIRKNLKLIKPNEKSYIFEKEQVK